MTDLQQAQQRLGRALERVTAGQGVELFSAVRRDGEQMLRVFFALVRLTRVYAPDNQAFDQPAAEFQSALERLVARLGPVQVVAVEDQAYVNDVRIRFREPTDVGRDLCVELGRHRLGGLTFHRAIDDREVRALAAALGATPRPDRPRGAVREALLRGGVVGVTVHGLFRFRLSGEEEETAPALATERRAVQSLRAVDEAFGSMVGGRVPGALPLRRVVSSILAHGEGAEGLWDEPDAASPQAAHTLRVCRFALIIGRAAGLTDSALQDLGVAAMFHDIGYAAREGATPAREGRPASAGYPPPFERHSAAGARLLLRQPGFHEAKVRRALAAMHHHRHYNAKVGRPFLFGRILLIADDFDNLIRPRGGGLSPHRALARIASLAGSRYDPALVQLFINEMGRYPPGTVMELADGRQVRSVAPADGPETFDRPRCVLLRGVDGSIPMDRVEVDLATDRTPVRRVVD